MCSEVGGNKIYPIIFLGRGLINCFYLIFLSQISFQKLFRNNNIQSAQRVANKTQIKSITYPSNTITIYCVFAPIGRTASRTRNLYVLGANIYYILGYINAHRCNFILIVR